MRTNKNKKKKRRQRRRRGRKREPEEKKNEEKHEDIGAKREVCERESEMCFIKQIIFSLNSYFIQYFKLQKIEFRQLIDDVATNL